jgi:hypothetical protein
LTDASCEKDDDNGFSFAGDFGGPQRIRKETQAGGGRAPGCEDVADELASGERMMGRLAGATAGEIHKVCFLVNT